MQHLEVSCAVLPTQWSLGVKWLILCMPSVTFTLTSPKPILNAPN